MNEIISLPGLKGKNAVITGAGGAICGAIAGSLAAAGVGVAIWDLSLDAAKAKAASITGSGGRAIAFGCDVTDRESVEQAAGKTRETFHTVDILINGAGGSRKDATTSPDLKFFDISTEGILDAVGLNYLGTVIPCQVIGRSFAERGSGVILNIASIAGIKPLTRAIGYSNAKAAVASFTEWLAIHMAREYNPAIRVNALAPGFVLTNQNRFLLEDKKTGEPTERGRLIMSQVPMGRYGKPEEMIGAAMWLVSDAATFVTGVVLPVDGGLMASAGV
ncbi:MAG: SDR family oxidoreductase [Spirochaetales bacterium]|nr:SDR family oxidoreductase [Spirochaetales bacterium]